MSVWRNARFVRLWVAEAVNSAGTQVTQLALPLTAIVLLHATPLQVGVLGAAVFVPYVLFGLPAGVVVDRTRPLPVMVGADVFGAVLLSSIPVAYLLHALTLPHLAAVAFFMGATMVVHGVAQQASVHGMVARDQLIDSSSLLELSDGVARVLGPGLGGLLITALRAPIAVVADAVSYLASALLLLTIRSPAPSQPKADERESFLRQMREGLAFIGRDPAIRAIALSLATVNLFSAVFEAIFLLYVVRVLHLAAGVIGLILAAGAMGAIAGAVLAPRVGRTIGVGRLIILCAAPVGLVLVPLAPVAAPIPWLIIAEVLASLFGASYNLTQRGLRQALTPARLQGRMTATIRFLILVPTPVGMTLGGFLGGVIGLRTTLWVAVVGMLFTAVPLLFSPIAGIRAIPALQPEPAG